MNIIASLPFLTLFSILYASGAWTAPVSDLKCDIAAFYKGVEPDLDTKVLTTYDNLEDAGVIFLPITLDEGVYKVQATRKGDNLYKLEGTNIYVETRFCYEFVIFQEATLKVDNRFGYTKGQILFE